MQQSPRNGATIDRIFVHSNEGPQGPNAAANLAGYLSRIDAGYHVIVDDANTVVCATDDKILWATGGDNTHSLSICLIGYAAFTPADWGTPYSQAMIERAAQQVAAWCRAYNVPVTRVRPGAPGQAPTDRGIAEHADDHAPESQGHTDPGASFPIDAFVARVAAILAPAPAVTAVSAKSLSVLSALLKAVTSRPIRKGDKGPKVLQLKTLLAKHGYQTPEGDVFGLEVIEAVRRFKLAHGLKPADGTIVARRCLLALYRAK